MFSKVYKSFIFGLFFLLMWQVTVLTVQKYHAHIELAEVGMQKPTSGTAYVGDLVSGTVTQLTSGIETGTVVAAGSVVAKSAAARAAISTVLAVASANPVGAATWAIGAGAIAIADSGFDARAKLKNNQAAFERVYQGEVGLNPALEGLANGMLGVQREQIKVVQSRIQMNEAVWIIASPVLTLIMVFGAWMLIGQIGAAAAGPVMAAGTQLGTSISSSIGGGLTRSGMGKGVGK